MFPENEGQLLPQGTRYRWPSWMAYMNVGLLFRFFLSLQTGDAAPWESVCVSLVGQAEAVTVPSAMPPVLIAMG